MRVLLCSGKEEYTGDTLVSSAVLHAALLYKLQHQFPAVRDVRHHIPAMFGADITQTPKEYDSVSLQSTEGIGKPVKHQRSLADDRPLSVSGFNLRLTQVAEAFVSVNPGINPR